MPGEKHALARLDSGLKRCPGVILSLNQNAKNL